MRIRVSVAVSCAAMCAAFGTGLASGSERSDTLPFSGGCGAHSPPKLAPALLGARARFTVPRGWNAVRGLTPGPTCAQQYLLINPPGNLGRLCEQDQVYAEAGAGFQTPASNLHPGYPVLGRGALPTVAGRRGAWEELDVGVSGKYAAYQVNAGYEAANRKLFYEVIVTPPPSYPGICHDAGPRARATAIQLARSFRVAVTDASTAQTFG